MKKILGILLIIGLAATFAWAEGEEAQLLLRLQGPTAIASISANTQIIVTQPNEETFTLTASPSGTTRIALSDPGTYSIQLVNSIDNLGTTDIDVTVSDDDVDSETDLGTFDIAATQRHATVYVHEQGDGPGISAAVVTLTRVLGEGSIIGSTDDSGLADFAGEVNLLETINVDVEKEGFVAASTSFVVEEDDTYVDIEMAPVSLTVYIVNDNEDIIADAGVRVVATDLETGEWVDGYTNTDGVAVLEYVDSRNISVDSPLYEVISPVSVNPEANPTLFLPVSTIVETDYSAMINVRASGVPIADVPVVLKREDLPSEYNEISSGLTDGDGVVLFPGLSPANYQTVIADADTYSGATDSFSITSAGVERTMNLALFTTTTTTALPGVTTTTTTTTTTSTTTTTQDPGEVNRSALDGAPGSLDFAAANASNIVFNIPDSDPGYGADGIIIGNGSGVIIDFNVANAHVYAKNLDGKPIIIIDDCTFDKTVILEYGTFTNGVVLDGSAPNSVIRNTTFNGGNLTIDSLGSYINACTFNNGARLTVASRGATIVDSIVTITTSPSDPAFTLASNSSYASILNCSFTGTGAGVGVIINGGSNHSIIDSTFSDLAIGVNADTVETLQDVTLENSNFSGNDVAINLAGANISDFNIANVSIVDGLDKGMSIAATNVFINDSTIANCQGDGISITGATNVDLNNVELRENGAGVMIEAGNGYDFRNVIASNNRTFGIRAFNLTQDGQNSLININHSTAQDNAGDDIWWENIQAANARNLTAGMMVKISVLGGNLQDCTFDTLFEEGSSNEGYSIAVESTTRNNVESDFTNVELVNTRFGADVQGSVQVDPPTISTADIYLHTKDFVIAGTKHHNFNALYNRAETLNIGISSSGTGSFLQEGKVTRIANVYDVIKAYSMNQDEVRSNVATKNPSVFGLQAQVAGVDQSYTTGSLSLYAEQNKATTAYVRMKNLGNATGPWNVRVTPSDLSAAWRVKVYDNGANISDDALATGSGVNATATSASYATTIPVGGNRDIKLIVTPSTFANDALTLTIAMWPNNYTAATQTTTLTITPSRAQIQDIAKPITAAGITTFYFNKTAVALAAGIINNTNPNASAVATSEAISAKLYVYDLAGKKLVERVISIVDETSSVDINTLSLGRGTYVYQLVQDGRVITQGKFVIVR